MLVTKLEEHGFTKCADLLKISGIAVENELWKHGDFSVREVSMVISLRNWADTRVHQTTEFDGKLPE